MLAVKAALVKFLIDQNMSGQKTDSSSPDNGGEEDGSSQQPQVYTENAEEGEEGSMGNEDDGESSSKSASDKPTVKTLTCFMCKFCGCQFTHRADMDAHASIHDDDKPPLKCGVCAKVYNTRSKLQRHVRVHSGERPFPCEVCGKRFPRSDHVKQHMRVHTKYPAEVLSAPNPIGLTQNKNYCRLCGVKFEQRSDLNQHLLTHGFNKLYSCIYCGEVFESNEKLKAHKLTHENHYDDHLPVLTIPDPSQSKASEAASKSRRKRPGRPRGSRSVSASKRKKDAATRLALARFKIARKSGSEDWQAVGADVKLEGEEDEEGSSTERSDQTPDKTMPILERILKEGNLSKVKIEQDEDDEGEGEFADKDDKGEERSETPQMEISACYSLAEGQDNSHIPDIDQIRASTLTDGNNMIVVPMNDDDDDDGDDDSQTSDDDEEMNEESGRNLSCVTTAVCAVSGSAHRGSADASVTSHSLVNRQVVVPSTATATATLMAIQQQVYPQIASVATSSFPTSSSSTSTTRPTISLLPNVLAFRTHPILTTPTLNLATTAVHPNAGSIYNTSNFYNTLGNFTAGQVLHRGSAPACSTDTFPLGRKMMRCQYCCIWFEDSALGLLHQSLHSADETDPFTCKKCLKRLGNRLEFTAHIIWHLDPTMEEGAVV